MPVAAAAAPVRRSLRPSSSPPAPVRCSRLAAITSRPRLPRASPAAKPTSDPCHALVATRPRTTAKATQDPKRRRQRRRITSTLDPLTSLGKGCAEAASWTIDKLSAAVTKTTEVDFTNTAFLRQYAVVFAASTILTLILWLLAVAKRAVRGVPMTEALTEAVGFLLADGAGLGVHPAGALHRGLGDGRGHHGDLLGHQVEHRRVLRLLLAAP